MRKTTPAQLVYKSRLVQRARGKELVFAQLSNYCITRRAQTMKKTTPARPVYKLRLVQRATHPYPALAPLQQTPYARLVMPRYNSHSSRPSPSPRQDHSRVVPCRINTCLAITPSSPHARVASSGRLDHIVCPYPILRHHPARALPPRSKRALRKASRDGKVANSHLPCVRQRCLAAWPLAACDMERKRHKPRYH